MYIVQVASECAPVIKAGMVLPMYNCMRYDHIWGLHEAYSNLKVPWYSGTICFRFFVGESMVACASLLGDWMSKKAFI